MNSSSKSLYWSVFVDSYSTISVVTLASIPAWDANFVVR